VGSTGSDLQPDRQPEEPLPPSTSESPQQSEPKKVARQASEPLSVSTVVTLLLTAIGVLAALVVVPEVRHLFGLDRYALTIQAMPVDSRITLLHRGLHYQPGIKLKPGTYRVRVEHDGYRFEERDIAIGNADVSINVALAPLTYSLHVRVHPPASHVTVAPAANVGSPVAPDAPYAYTLSPGEYALTVAHDGYATHRQQLLIQNQDVTLDLHLTANNVMTNRIGMTFVRIPAGAFMMGSPGSDPHAYPHEAPVQQVQLSQPFYLSQYEVTQGQWQRIMGEGENPSQFKGDDRPVERVS
jgi:Sulfatase-modifying factor enzyme 1